MKQEIIGNGGVFITREYILIGRVPAKGHLRAAKSVLVRLHRGCCGKTYAALAQQKTSALQVMLKIMTST